MSIVALEKVTLYGPAAACETVLDELQRLGRLHLIDLRESGERPPAEGLVSPDGREALKYLLACPQRRRKAKPPRDFDASAVVLKSLENKRRLQSLAIERELVGQALEDLAPWGEFNLPVRDQLGGNRIWFYVVPRRDAKDVAQLSVPYEVVREDPTSLYIAAVAPEEPAAAPGARADLDPRPLSELAARRDELDDELDNLQWARIELTRWVGALQRSLDALDDRAARQWAGQLALRDEELFAVQAWAPRAARGDVEAVARQYGLAVTFDDPGPADDPPTLLKNPDRVAGAEGAVTFYLTPAYRAWDPTPVMFVSFSLFFGMIMADAGYGVLLAAALALFWRRLGATATGARFRNLLKAIVAATIVFGVLAGSYFGLSPRPESLLGRLRVLDFAERGQMMALSILIGVAHLAIANLITAWRGRGSWRALGPVGWVLLMLGTLMMTSAMLEYHWTTFVAPLGKWVAVLGGLGVLGFSSDRPLRGARIKDWIGRLLDGLSALTGVSKLFGDVLSYLRLFALGLASAQLAVTFNQLAADMSQSRGPGLLLAGVILIVGHGINLVLGLMGGVVHGLRLNCIEFFNWSLTEEGTPFRCYQKKGTH